MTRFHVTAIAAVLATLATTGAHAQSTINLTVIDGYPPKSLWIKEFIDFYIPEVDKRLAKDNKYKIKWNQAWGGQIVKPDRGFAKADGVVHDQVPSFRPGSARRLRAFHPATAPRTALVSAAVPVVMRTPSSAKQRTAIPAAAR